MKTQPDTTNLKNCKTFTVDTPTKVTQFSAHSTQNLLILLSLTMLLLLTGCAPNADTPIKKEIESQKSATPEMLHSQTYNYPPLNVTNRNQSEENSSCYKIVNTMLLTIEKFPYDETSTGILPANISKQLQFRMETHMQALQEHSEGCLQASVSFAISQIETLPVTPATKWAYTFFTEYFQTHFSEQ